MSQQNPHTLSSFIDSFKGGFRPNRFLVEGNIGAGQSTTKFHIQTASLPGSKISTMEIPYRGRVFKMPGNRDYTGWDITVLDDASESTGTQLWDDFHQWSENFNDHETNRIDSTLATSFGAATPSQDSAGKGMNNWTVKQLDIDGNSRKEITLVNCWPSKVGPIVLSMDKNDELVTFAVTLQYQYIQDILDK
jgi:hypothetical protein